MNGNVECWIEDFETWLSGGGGTGSFPSSNLNSDLALFIKTNEGIPHFYKNYIGFIDGKLKFTMIRALSQGIAESSHSKLNPIYEDWVDEMKSVNEVSGNGLNKGIMTGGIYFTWMRSEQEFARSARNGIMISMVFAFIILNLSTLNLLISLFSIICIA